MSPGGPKLSARGLNQSTDMFATQGGLIVLEILLGVPTLLRHVSDMIYFSGVAHR